ncbi:MAG TPA: ABC transporter permease [Chthonomonadaceae bacterium]|nr:ABC transporter permease [Chthonomonadaceae bacterium]
MPDLTALAGTLQQTLTMATPLLLAALGENVTQRSGVVNVGIEGTMLGGAFCATLVTLATGSPALGVAAGALAGTLVAALFAAIAVRMTANQVVVGIVINLLAQGVTGTLYERLFGRRESGLSTAALPHLLGDQNALFLFAVAAAPLAWYWLARTKGGLQLRACGEEPAAAEAAGLNVLWIRTAAALFGGAMAGVAGASLSVGASNTFIPNMTAGRGFIALAIVTAGRWNPLGCLCAALIFGLADALQYRGQSLGIQAPKDMLLALPYIATLAILAAGYGTGSGPAALGRPFRKA